MDDEQIRARLQVLSDAPLEERSDDLEELIGVLESELERTSALELAETDTP